MFFLFLSLVRPSNNKLIWCGLSLLSDLTLFPTNYILLEYQYRGNIYHAIMGIFYKVHALINFQSFCTGTYKCFMEGLELQINSLLSKYSQQVMMLSSCFYCLQTLECLKRLFEELTLFPTKILQEYQFNIEEIYIMLYGYISQYRVYTE